MTVIDQLHKLNRNVAIKIVKHHTRGTVTTAVNKGAGYIAWKI